MLNQVLLAFVTVFAVVGFLTILYSIVDAFSSRKTTLEDTELVMFVKNREDDIEGIVRMLGNRLKNPERTIEPIQLSVVDYGSTDTTKALLEKLTKDIDILEFYTKDQFLEHLEQYN